MLTCYYGCAQAALYQDREKIKHTDLPFITVVYKLNLYKLSGGPTEGPDVELRLAVSSTIIYQFACLSLKHIGLFAVLETSDGPWLEGEVPENLRGALNYLRTLRRTRDYNARNLYGIQHKSCPCMGYESLRLTALVIQ